MAQRRKPFEELVLVEGTADDSRPDAPVVPGASTPTGDLQTTSVGKNSAVPAGKNEGQVLGIEKDKIFGWAWDASRPYEPVQVELFIDDLRVGRGKADQFDIVLAKENRGNGMHRFEIGLDRLPASAPPFVIRSVIAGTEEELLPAITLTSIEDAERLLSGSEYIGKVTGVVDGMLCGWVLNWHNPHEEPVLSLRDGEANVLIKQAKGRTSAVVNAGVTVNAHRFELPLPASVLDGKLHVFSVLVGASGRELPGSPVMFGPADIASIGQSIAASFDRQQELERKVSSLQQGYDLSSLERQIASSVLDRVDMLLNIHRDAIERELAVLRRQVTELIRQAPEGESDVIRPEVRVAVIEDHKRQPADSFAVMARSAPLISYNLEAHPESVRPVQGLKWSNNAASAGLAITSNGSLELDGVPAGPTSLILRGTGARNPYDFCGIVTSFHGRALTGHVEVNSSGDWTLVGTTVNGPADDSGVRGLGITFLPNLVEPGGQLCLKQIAVFHRGRMPERVDPRPPQTAVLYLGTDKNLNGWYAAETGPRGGFCWMGAYGELVARVHQTGEYQLKIPEIRPLVPDIMPRLEITLCGVPMNVDVSAVPGDPTVFQVNANVRVPRQETGSMDLRLSFPSDSVRSPMELGLNDDQRPLTIAVRAIALSAVEN
jgi:hypothetical protein